MNKEKVFCVECKKETTYSVITSRVEMTVRGTTFSYIELSAICNHCGEEIYVPEINDANVMSSENAYREARHLITHKELLNILEKYNIGAGPLAKLVGFGEITINRYMSGRVPSKEHSDFLLQLMNDRKLMEEYLEKGKDNISPTAYVKCRRAIDDLNSLYSNDKIDLITRYILSKSCDITPLALQKLLYYAQAFYYAIFNDVLFENECQAWVLGPVYPDVYYKYKGFGYNPIENSINIADDDFNQLTTKEKDFLDVILCAFGRYSGKILSEMTHKEKPWIEARGNLQPEDRCVTTISRNAINEYFASVVAANDIINPCDILNYSSALYEKVVQNCIYWNITFKIRELVGN